MDLYHAREHLWDIAGKLFPNDQSRKKSWGGELKEKLRAFSAPNAEIAEAIRIEADYFERNAHRMRYMEFRKQKLFVGSSVIEAACRTVVAQRLKRSGMFWTVQNANSIIALRCCRLNQKFEDYWATRSIAA